MIMGDLKQRVEQAEIDCLDAKDAFEESKINYRISKERLRKAEHEMVIAKYFFEKQKAKSVEGVSGKIAPANL